MLGWNRSKKSEEKPEKTGTRESKPAPQSPQKNATPAYRANPAAASGASSADLPKLLLAEGKVSEKQLAAALEKQKETGAFLGEILIEQGTIDETSLISFLTKYCKVPHLSLLDYLIDPEIVSLIPKEVCLKYRLLPIDKLGSNLTVAMVNPLDQEAMQAVRENCPNLRIKPILCAHKHFDTVAAKVFRDAKSGDPVEMSASSFGLTIEKKKDAPAAAPPAEPKPAAEEKAPPKPAPAPEPEPAPAPGEPEPEPAPPPNEPEPEPAAKEPEPSAVRPEPGPEAAAELEAPAEAASAASREASSTLDADSIFDRVFHAREEGGDEAPAEAVTEAPPEESAAGPSSVMEEMASIMMDSMRDTYSMLARRMELFQGVAPEDVARVFARGVTMEFDPGQEIFQKGDPGDALYLILGGRVEIIDEDDRIAELDRGDMFGEMALISQEPRSASARALEATSILALNNDIIHNVIPRDVSVQLLVNIVVTLSRRLRTANQR